MAVNTAIPVGHGGLIFAQPATKNTAQSQADQITDTDLLGRIVKGETAAMRSLFARHNVRVFRFVLRLIDDRAMAEDVVGDVFFEVWRSAANFRGQSQVSTWIIAIARFKAISALRKRRDESLDEADAAAIVDLAEGPEETLHNKKRAAVVSECLKHLSRVHREVIDLVYYHEKSIDEVAQILGIPPNTVKTRMFYARRRMSTLLEQAGLHQTFQ